MTVKRMIFVLSPGRCGTMYFYEVMRTVPGVCSLHEPPPAFHLNSRLPRDERLAWLRDVKVRYVLGRAQDVYFESSAQFVRGWPELFLELGIAPDAVVLRRPHREVALSMWRMGYVPARSWVSTVYGIRPDDEDGVLRAADFGGWSDYQMCYWNCLEVERRSEGYAGMLAAAGARVYRTTTAELVTRDGMLGLIKKMGLPEPGEAFEAARALNYNATRREARDRWPWGDLEGQEKEIEKMFGMDG